MIRSENSQRLGYLDGLRGVAALAVLVGHTLLSLAPMVVTVPAPAETSTTLVRLAISVGKSPVGLLWNGNSAVCIFFVLSGYVMTDFALGTSLGFAAQIIRRYVRLAIPVLLTSTFAYLLLRFGLFHNLKASEIASAGWLGFWYQFEPSFASMMFESLVGTFLNGKSDYNPNLWTMHAELLGSFYILLICSIGRSRRERAVLYAIFAAYYVYDYLPLFAFGALLREYAEELRNKMRPGYLALVALVVGSYFCSLPDAAPDNPLPWHVLMPRIFSFDNTRYWHSIGAALIVLGVLHSPAAQRVLISNIARFLGRISFTLYLIHIPILCSLVSWLIVMLAGRHQVFIVGVCFPLAISLSVGLSALLNSLVDESGIRLSRAAGKLVNSAIGLAGPRFVSVTPQRSPHPSSPAQGTS